MTATLPESRRWDSRFPYTAAARVRAMAPVEVVEVLRDQLVVGVHEHDVPVCRLAQGAVARRGEPDVPPAPAPAGRPRSAGPPVCRSSASEPSPRPVVDDQHLGRHAPRRSAARPAGRTDRPGQQQFVVPVGDGDRHPGRPRASSAALSATARRRLPGADVVRLQPDPLTGLARQALR